MMTPCTSAMPQLWSTFATARAPTSSTSEKMSVSMMMGFGRRSLGVEMASTLYWLAKTLAQIQISSFILYRVVAIEAVRGCHFWSTGARVQTAPCHVW